MDIAAPDRPAGTHPAEDLAPGLRPDSAFAPAIPLGDAAEPLVVYPDYATHMALPMVHRDRPPMHFDLPAAWRYFQKFREDKEQTRYVFNIFDSLPWSDVDQYAQRFLATEKGARIYATEPFLPDVLDDHDALRRLPAGSLAHAYCDFIESHAMSAKGLVAEYDLHREGRPRINDRVEWYIDRLRDTHDLLHVLNGFDTDTLGEQCVLTFVCHQRHSIGHAFLGFAGTAVMLKEVRTRAPVFRAAWEAWRNGKVARPIHEEAIRELLPMPLDDVRRTLNIRPAHYYQKAQHIWREEEGVDPHMVLARAA